MFLVLMVFFMFVTVPFYGMAPPAAACTLGYCRQEHGACIRHVASPFFSAMDDRYGYAPVRSMGLLANGARLPTMPIIIHPCPVGKPES